MGKEKHQGVTRLQQVPPLVREHRCRRSDLEPTETAKDGPPRSRNRGPNMQEWPGMLQQSTKISGVRRLMILTC